MPFIKLADFPLFLGANLRSIIDFTLKLSASNTQIVKSENPCQQTLSKIELGLICAGNAR